jgi:hypothetical protein
MRFPVPPVIYGHMVDTGRFSITGRAQIPETNSSLTATFRLTFVASDASLRLLFTVVYASMAGLEAHRDNR